MELVTKEVCGEYKYELICNNVEKFIEDMGAGNRFRIILIQNGSGMLKIGDQTEVFTSPTILCINEKENLIVDKSIDLSAKSVYFDPVIINSRFNYENIRECPDQFSQTEINDLRWLLPFIERDNIYNGRMSPDIVVAKQICRLMDSIETELTDQKDRYWPCRSRSFLLELLFLLERAYNEPGVIHKSKLRDISSEINEMILYFHVHYMEKITIDKLTKQFHMNRTTLSERFLKETGVTVMAYLIKLRISLAALMLKDTSIPVYEIMERVSFKDDGHFNRMFRKYMGLSPKSYRQQFNKL